jgi:hypothetical protein
MDGLIITEEGWPNGLRCMDCNEALAEGAPYSNPTSGIHQRTMRRQ